MVRRQGACDGDGRPGDELAAGIAAGQVGFPWLAAGAAAVISLTSWAMIFSGPLWGHVADRTGRRDLVLYACLAVGVASLFTAAALANLAFRTGQRFLPVTPAGARSSP